MEMLELEHGVVGLAFNLEEDDVGAALFGEWEQVKEGEPVRRTGQRRERARSARRCSAASSTRSATRSTGAGPIEATETRPLEFKAPGVIAAPAGEGAARRPASSRSTR